MLSDSPAGLPPPRSPSRIGDPWARRLFAVLAVALIARILYAAVFPLDLAPDESYYWDWGRRPDWGYFSKPPMVGWLMAVAGWLGNNSQFGIKAFPAVLATVGLVFVFLLGRSMSGSKTGFQAAMLLLATPGNAALSAFFTIDAPLFVFWSASLWLAWEWWNASPERAWRWAFGLAVALGCAALAKQIALVFFLLLAWFVAIAPRRSDAARKWQLPAILFGALLFLAPPLFWNWQHDWITLRHTADELQRPAHSLARRLGLFGEFVGGQAALGGLLPWSLMFIAAFSAVKRWRVADSATRFLALFFIPGFIAFAAVSLSQRVEQNWPMVFYVSASVLAARWLPGEGDARLGTGLRLGVVSVAVGGALALALLAVPFVVPKTSMAGSRSDPTARIRGWRELARAVQEVRTGVPRPDSTFLLVGSDRYAASALAFYLPDQPRVFRYEDPRRPESQYGIWGLPADRAGWDALVIAKASGDERVAIISNRFGQWRPAGRVEISLGPSGDRDRAYNLFLGENFRPPE